MTLVTVMRCPFVRAWPRHRNGDRVFALGLAAALPRSYTSDAHFSQYVSPNGRRLSREAVDELDGIELAVVAFDLDGPDHVSTEPWRRELREKVQALDAAHPGVFYYETRGGARIVYRQTEPTVIRTQRDAQAWGDAYAVGVAYLARRFDIVADPACNDWQRLFRLPHATRGNSVRPENHPTLGDAREIGTLRIAASVDDMRRAEREAKAFRQRKPLEFVQGNTQGEGLLFWLLRARGDLGPNAPRGGWIIRCPNRAQHTIDTCGNDSTVLYPPSSGEQIGAIDCKHGHCRGMTVAKWLRFFSDHEQAAARLAAGINRAA